MSFQWYRLFHLQDFLDLGLVSKEFQVVLGDLGEKTVLVTQGAATSILIDDVFLTINLNGKNPFRYGENAVFLDDNGDVWFGVFSDD